MVLTARIEDGVVYSPFGEKPVLEISLYEAVKRSLPKYGDRTALVCEDEQITFSELLKMFQRYAAGFQRHGVKRGDKVLVHVDTALENIIATYSVIFAGGVAVLAGPVLTDDDLRFRLVDSNVKHVLTICREAHRFVGLVNGLPIEGYFVFGSSPGFVSVTEFRHINESLFREVVLENPRNELAVLLYTSGTTGTPKAAEQTHCALVEGLRDSWTGSEEPLVAATWFRPTCSAGFRYYLFSACSGDTTVIPSKESDFSKAANVLKKHEVTTMVSLMTHLQQFSSHVIEKGLHVNCVNTIMISGAVVTERAAKKLFSAFDLKAVSNPYGTTETGGVCRQQSGVIAYDSMGYPYPNVQIKIVDMESGKLLGPGEPGDMLVKTPQCMRGYYRNPQATAETITHDGWIRTGDVAYYDESGVFYFVERKKQYFHCMGRQVPPFEIEKVLLSYEGVEEAAVIAVYNETYVEVAKAFVVLSRPESTPGKVKASDLEDLVKERLSISKWLYGGVEFVDFLPKNVNGKVDKKALRLRGKDQASA